MFMSLAPAKTLLCKPISHTSVREQCLLSVKSFSIAAEIILLLRKNCSYLEV